MKLCIFDLDGTILYTLKSIAYYVNEALAYYGIAPIDEEIIKSFVGNGAYKLIERSLKYRSSNISVDNVLRTYMDKYNSNATYLVTPYDGMCETLVKLKENGVSIAVLSNKPHSSTVLILDKLFGTDYFYSVRGYKEGEAAKPDPTVANEIASGFNKNECFFIGDSSVDILTGKNAGVKTIGAAWGFCGAETLKNAGADFIAQNPKEILKFVI